MKFYVGSGIKNCELVNYYAKLLKENGWEQTYDWVKNISDDMFRGCRSLKEITIPEGVERIIGGAFLGCWSLESVNLPSTLTEIGSHCFGSCKSLTNITIPKNVSRIGEKAFSNCNALTDIYYGSSEQDWNAAVETDVFVTNESDAGVIDVTVHYNQ